MNFTILSNGNLEITRDDDDVEELEDVRDRSTSDYVMAAEICELTGWTGNGRLYAALPEWVGALTDAPIFTDDLVHPEDGPPLVRGNVWWFPDYAVLDPFVVLIYAGSVVFQRA